MGGEPSRDIASQKCGGRKQEGQSMSGVHRERAKKKGKETKEKKSKE